MNHFPTGHRSDSFERQRPGHKQIAARFGTMQDTASMVQFRGPQLWQDGLGACWPTTISRVVYAQELAQKGTGRLISSIFGYGVARAIEAAGLPRDIQPTTLDDTGVSPGLAEDAYKMMGVCLDKDLPSPWNPAYDPSMANRIDERWQPAIDSAYDKRGMVIHEIDVSPSGRGDACIDLLNRLIMPVVTWHVDDAYMQNLGELVTDMGSGGPNHAQAILQVDPDEILADNWWRWNEAGAFWGCHDGTGRISRKTFESLPAFQCRIYAVTFLPESL